MKRFLSQTLRWFPALVADVANSITSTAARLMNGTTLKTLCVGSANKCLTFRANCVRLFEVMRERKTFLNATFKVEKNPTYTGNHYMARVNRVLSNTYPLGTTEQEMIDKYHNSVVLEKDLDGNKVLAGDIHRVVEVSFYEDSIDDNDLRITHD